MRSEAEIRRDAKMWALVAELEALKTQRRAMEAHDESTDGGHYTEESYFSISVEMQEVARRLEEI
jgi:hypothetical protein